MQKKYFPLRFSSLMLLIWSLPGKAELYFNVNALHLNDELKAQTDLSLLSRTDIQMPGKYKVQVSINNIVSGEHTLQFVTCENKLCPQLSPALLNELGVKITAFPALASMAQDAQFTDISAYIRQANSEFDFNKSQLNISVPQAALNSHARGDVPPELWEDGLPMLFTSYSASGSEDKYHQTGEDSSSQYLNLRSGANLGPWRLRNYSYYNRSTQGEASWNSMQTWLERDIRSLRSRMVVGETSSPGLIFDSFTFRGAYLASQDEMLPDSMRGYAPEVRGVAITNATVEIRQNGNLLYQTFVSPGEFIIKDLFPTTTSGDLTIIVKEEDGTVRTFTQAYASPPISIRKGVMKYSATTGEYGTRYYSNNENAISQKFAQAEILYGLLNNTSLYSGITAAQNYRAAVAGVGQGMGVLGAVSVDITRAESTFSDDSTRSGQSLQVKYSKNFDTTGTNMTLAGYRYATDGYYTFDEASNYYYNSGQASRYSLKNKAQITLSQNLGLLGSVSLSAYQSEYWNRSEAKNRSVTGSWSKTFDGITISLNQSQSKVWNTDRTDNTTSVSVSLPLGKWLSPSHDSSALRMNNSYSHSDQGTSSLTTTLSGSALADNNLSWSLSQARNSQSNGADKNSTSLSGTYQGGQATASLGYLNYYGESQRLNWGVRGAVVAHPYGVTLSQPLTEGGGYALVRAPEANGVRVKNRTGLTTDYRGYAVVPSLMPYRENDVSLDTESLGEDVDLVNPLQRKIPSREALVLADYQTRVGYRAFLTLTHSGKLLPLGAVVNYGDASGITNEKGQIYLTGIEDKVLLKATLAGGNTCEVPFHVNVADKKNGILMASLECKG